MCHNFILFLTFLGISFHANSQADQDKHLLDGSSMDYYYNNAGGVHAEFHEGQFIFEWIAGPNKGASGSSNYRSRKIGRKIYLVNFYYEPSKAFVTIVFNFNENVFSTSALLQAGTEEQMILFEDGIIKRLKLSENQENER